MADWRPIGQTAEEAATLEEGVPAWMANVLWAWIATQLKRTDGASGLRLDLIDDFEQRRKSRTPITLTVASQGISALRSPMWWEPERDVIPFVDYLVTQVASKWQGDRALESLEELLERNGSAWKVGTRDGHPGLERRVPLGVQETAEHVMDTAGDAGKRLSEAWRAAFGVNPDPSKAYGLAIKAVEDAAKPVVTPKDRLATLGKMNNVVKDQVWVLPLQREDPKAPTSDVLLGMMRALWSGQVDRHGGSDDPEHREVTQEAAETAVMLAVPLVQWFTSGAAAPLI